MPRIIFFIALILIFCMGVYVMAMPVLIPFTEDELEFTESDMDDDMIPMFKGPGPDGQFPDQWIDAWMDQPLYYMDWEDFMGLSYFVVNAGIKDERGRLLGYEFDFVNTDIGWWDHKMIKAETVPVPTSVLLLGSGIVALVGLRSRKKRQRSMAS